LLLFRIAEALGDHGSPEGQDRGAVDVDRKPADHDDTPQIDRFKALARGLGCDEDEDAFNAALKRGAE
jgi:hypothetical protein